MNNFLLFFPQTETRLKSVNEWCGYFVAIEGIYQKKQSYDCFFFLFVIRNYAIRTLYCNSAMFHTCFCFFHAN